MELAQFTSKIKSIQRGIISIPVDTTIGSATVTAVDTSKAVLNLLGTDATGSLSSAYIKLTNATTIDAVGDYSPATTISWELIEYV